jgi:hypothetical protein
VRSEPVTIEGLWMRSIPVELIALFVIAPIACASMSEQRRDYILAHPHG